MNHWRMRGLRGATTVEDNEPEAILEATRELVETMISTNELDVTEIASIIFTTSPDLNATFPAEAARRLGLTGTPLLCASEIEVPGSLRRCVRVLMHVNTQAAQAQMQHVYLRGAQVLRPDLVEEE